MLFRFNKLFSVVVGIIVLYSGKLFIEPYNFERLSLEYLFYLFLFGLLWNLMMRTYNWICFGIFQDVLFISKKEFENIKYKKN